MASRWMDVNVGCETAMFPFWFSSLAVVDAILDNIVCFLRSGLCEELSEHPFCFIVDTVEKNYSRKHKKTEPGFFLKVVLWPHKTSPKLNLPQPRFLQNFLSRHLRGNLFLLVPILSPLITVPSLLISSTSSPSPSSSSVCRLSLISPALRLLREREN